MMRSVLIRNPIVLGLSSAVCVCSSNVQELCNLNQPWQKQWEMLRLLTVCSCKRDDDSEDCLGNGLAWVPFRNEADKDCLRLRYLPVWQ